MTPLEHAGWVAVAREMLDLQPGEAKALKELALSAGRFVERERLDACSGRYESEKRPRGDISRRLPTRISRIRNALVDVGFPPGVIESSPSIGYAMPPRHAARLRHMIENGALA